MFLRAFDWSLDSGNVIRDIITEQSSDRNGQLDAKKLCKKPSSPPEKGTSLEMSNSACLFKFRLLIILGSERIYTHPFYPSRTKIYMYSYSNFTCKHIYSNYTTNLVYFSNFIFSENHWRWWRNEHIGWFNERCTNIWRVIVILYWILKIQDKNSKFELSQMHELHKQSKFYITRRNATPLVVGDHLYKVNRYNLTKRRVISKTIIFFDNWRRLIVDNCVNPVLIILPLSRSRLILLRIRYPLVCGS